MKPCVEFYDFFFFIPPLSLSFSRIRKRKKISSLRGNPVFHMLPYSDSLQIFTPTSLLRVTEVTNQRRNLIPFFRRESVAVLASFAVGHLHKIIINAPSRGYASVVYISNVGCTMRVGKFFFLLFF